jgi:hypothetical protein|tara:strand:+ start:817 stop:1542 length:726 start_codon:yes stop_codon:yes gene_type:complete
MEIFLAMKIELKSQITSGTMRVRKIFSSTVCALLLTPLLLPSTFAFAQTTDRLLAGDSIRVSFPGGRQNFEGRVLSNVDGVLEIVGKGPQNCTTGRGFGARPVCDPAPTERIVIDPNIALVEQYSPSGGNLLLYAGGAVLGGIGVAVAGRILGPKIGLGRIEGCQNIHGDLLCRNPIDDFDEKQLASDKKRGTIFGGIFGATVVPLLIKAVQNPWVELRAGSSEAPGFDWSFEFSVPFGGQ